MTVKVMPDMKGLHRTYPNTGGSVILPLSSRNNFEPTIMICGGGGWQGIDSPAEASCGSIQPMSDQPQWTYTLMPEGRCMVEGILLLDGTVLWINGAKRGAQGFGIADQPALEALIYDPVTGSWARGGKSNIARLYHSVALMLLDGTILIAGSNPNEMPVLLENVNPHNQYTRFPTEFRMERWTPPYLMGSRSEARPYNVHIDRERFDATEDTFRITFESVARVKNVQVVLYRGGFVTHALHMGQVMVQLDHFDHRVTGDGLQEITVQIPMIALAPGPYVIYVLVNGVPSIGQFFTLHR